VNRLNEPTPVLLAAVRPNAGIEAWYRRVLDNHIHKMQRSVAYWIISQYDAASLGLDALPASQLQRELGRLTSQWETAFTRLARWLPKKFAERVQKYSDNALDSRLPQGIRVRFTMSQAMRDAYQAVINEQVGLIKSIPRRHIDEIQGLVMRSVSRGRDLHFLTRQLTKRYGVTKRRAELIARDQNNKATSVMQAARQRELGITSGVWQHSHAGKHPRISHIHADGKEFELAKGMFIDGEWIMPGELINCRCTWRPVIQGFKVTRFD
jgi:SPP1 gp7 family putative phage head morphogenesis protein